MCVASKVDILLSVKSVIPLKLETNEIKQNSQKTNEIFPFNDS